MVRSLTDEGISLTGLQQDKIADIKAGAALSRRRNRQTIIWFASKGTQVASALGEPAGSMPILSLTASRNRCLQPR